MEWLKPIHVVCVVLSFSGFFLRGIWMLLDSDLLFNKWAKILPHIIDTVLLSSALLMLFFLRVSVFEQSWLMAKIIALLVYIILGMVTLRGLKNKPVRAVAWCSALFVFLYIVSVALTKSPYGFMVWV